MNILLLQLKRIGDLILTTPAIAAVRQHFPEADISLVVSEGTSELLPAIPGLSHTFVGRGKIRDAAKWFKLVRRKYDVCLDFTHNDRSAFLAALSAARKRITYRHASVQSKVRALSYNTFVPASLRELHTVDYHLALLEPLGIREPAPEVRLELPTTARETAGSALRAADVHGDFVLFHPGSARIEKFWEADRWGELIDFATKANLPCVVTGGTEALERAHVAQIRAACGDRFIDFSGHLDLLTLAALIEKARLLVTVDSAPMHLAVAFQTPQVVLFGPTNPLHWRPRFSPAIILQAGEAAPVTQFSANRKGAAMNLISTAQVIDGMKALLATPRGAHV